MFLFADITYIKLQYGTLKSLTMENTVLNTNFSYNNLYDSSDPLFNSYYDSSYNDSDLSLNSRHNPSVDTFNPIFNFSYDFSDLFLENDEIANEIQIGNESLVDFLKNHMKDRQKVDSEYYDQRI